MKVLVALVGLYFAYAVAMVALHPRFIYPFAQDPFEASGWTRPAVQGSDISVVARQGQSDVAVLFFMGNVGALTYFTPTLDTHVLSGRPLAALEFRGGGGIAGTPSERQLKADALVAYDWLRSTHDGPLVVHGYSMGTGLAVYVASERGVDAVILDAPFFRMCELMAKASYLPACLLPGVQKWDSAGLVAQIDAPVLVQHGELDNLISLDHGQRLVRRMQDRGLDVTFHTLPGTGHNDVALQPSYPTHITDFLDRVVRR